MAQAQMKSALGKTKRLLLRTKARLLESAGDLVFRRGQGQRLTRIVELTKKRDSVPGVYDYRTLDAKRQIKIEDAAHCRYLRNSGGFESFTGEQREVFLATIADAKFDAKSGVVCTADNVLIAESAMEAELLKASTAYCSFLTPTPRLQGTYSSIWHSPNYARGYNYYHWMIDCLPRTYPLSEVKTDETITLLMPDDLKSFQKESLPFCLPQNVQIKPIAAKDWVHVEKFILPGFASCRGRSFVYAKSLEYVKRSLFKAFGFSRNHEYTHNIYISRKKSTNRRVANEEEVVEFLSKYGFKSYSTEDLSFEEQVRLFHDANIVVAPHGAGVTNILFSGKISVLELFPTDVPSPHYFFLSQSLGQKYHYLFSDMRLGNSARSRNDDFHVNLSELEKTMSTVLQRSPESA